MKLLIVIPTLNESRNITIIYKKIIKLYSKAKILFIDDNSSDGSKKEIISLNKKNKNVAFIFRSHKFCIFFLKYKYFPKKNYSYYLGLLKYL